MKILSISIAAYNVEKYIKSLIQQFIAFPDLNKIELIIVNDGSTDNTAKLVQQLMGPYSDSIHLIDKENGGWGSTVTASIKKATGKYYKLLDADDFFCMENLTEFLRYLEKCDTDIVITPYKIFNDEDLIPKPSTRKEELYDHNEIKTIHQVDSVFQMHELTFRTDLLKKTSINLLEHCLYTDVEYAAKGMAVAETISFYNKAIYLYRLGRDGQSVSLVNRVKHFEDHYKVLQSVYCFRNELDRSSSQYSLLSELLERMIMRHYYLLLSIPVGKQGKKEVVKFDRWVKKHCADLLNNPGKSIILLQLSHFALYPIIARHIRKLEERK